MFDKATRLKLRFQSPKGYVSTEDLWDFKLEQLNTMAKTLNKQLKESSEVDFLLEKSEEDARLKLMFDIVLHIMDVKKAEQKAREDATARKAEKEKIKEILAKKQDDALEKLSEEELRKKLEELS